MVQLIIGNKGKGKTKHLLDKVNARVKEISGNIVYLDKNAKHMYDLNNKIRLINMSEFDVSNQDEFVGFIYGIISQDNDLEEVYCDSIFQIAELDKDDLSDFIQKLESISEKYKLDFIICAGVDSDELPTSLESNVVVSL